jgi:Ran GTPase-activating protein (RanGAP) involved in mRNA processing and transport
LRTSLLLILESIGYHNVTLIDRIEKCDQRLMGLNKKQLNDQDMLIVVQRAIIKKQCKELNLQSNEITWRGASILADALTSDTNLQILYLHNNHISDSGVQYFAQSLSTKNVTLKTLDLGSNDITDEGAEYLSEMLKTNQTLVHLYLRNNQIGDRGVQALVNALAYQNKTLEELVLDQNKMISDSCVEVLMNMLIQNQSLKTLRIWECNLDEVRIARLRDVIKHKHGFTLSA